MNVVEGLIKFYLNSILSVPFGNLYTHIFGFFLPRSIYLVNVIIRPPSSVAGAVTMRRPLVSRAT